MEEGGGVMGILAMTSQNRIDACLCDFESTLEIEQVRASARSVEQQSAGTSNF